MNDFCKGMGCDGAAAFMLFLSVAHAHCQTPDAFNPGTNSKVVPLTIFQPDGRVLCEFDPTGASGTGRLNSDGTLDFGFYPAVSGTPLVVLADGKILVSSNFQAANGSSSNTLVRLNADGAIDPSFAPIFLGDGSVNSVAVQTDGKMLIGGLFNNLGRQACTNIGRLGADGSVDLFFNHAVSGASDGAVLSIAVQPDGKILAAGRFRMLAGYLRTCLIRLNSDGSLDPGFDAHINGPSPQVCCLALQADDRILVGGSFITLGGTARTNFGRLNIDGSLDIGFSPWALGLGPSSMALEADGRIIVVGLFSTLQGQARTGIARLNSDGSLDASFDAKIDPNPIHSFGSFWTAPYVNSVALQPDGKILAQGLFISVDGQSRSNYARINNTDPATNYLAFDGSTISWLRGGTAPEIWHTSFDGCTNGTDWFKLGVGQRTSGGWQVADVPLSSSTISVRARGYVQSGSPGASAWAFESLIGPPAISLQPASQTNHAGAVAEFNVLAGGSLPPSYQWYKNGENLIDSGNVSGAQTATLRLTNILNADVGAYSVVVSSALGTVMSKEATLAVVEPFITSQPTNQLASAGEIVTLSVEAAATPPITYQWLKDGGPLFGGTSMPLVLTTVQWSNRGAYQVVISNTFGNATSDVAVLTVNLATPDSFCPAADCTISALAVQTDGKILVGGCFANLAGQKRNLFGRLNPDGTLDAAFDPGTNIAGTMVSVLAVQPDGKILLSGQIATLDGKSGLIRLNPDGTFDEAFNSNNIGAISCLALESDGSIIAGRRNLIQQIKADGSADHSIWTADGIVNVIAVQADGKILWGGFSQGHKFVGRLNADGSLDTNFNPGADNAVEALAVQGDGKILVGGFMRNVGGLALNGFGHLARLNQDGSVDPSFNPGADADVLCFATQADGHILVGGNFRNLAGAICNAVGRLNSDGSIDPTFNLGLKESKTSNSGLVASPMVDTVTVQTDGKVLLGGVFNRVAGQSCAGLARLEGDVPSTHALTFDGWAITWARGGSTPEVLWAGLDASTNGLDWCRIGSGARISGGWRLSGVILSSNSIIRASGPVAANQEGASSWFVQDLLAVNPLMPPSIITYNSGFGLESGQFGFDLTGMPDEFIVIESSSDLRQWTAVATNSPQSGRFHYIDTQTAIFPWHFFRARRR